jgi:hypothetical protein
MTQEEYAVRLHKEITAKKKIHSLSDQELDKLLEVLNDGLLK